MQAGIPSGRTERKNQDAAIRATQGGHAIISMSLPIRFGSHGNSDYLRTMQPFRNFTLNLRGRLLDIDRPQVMGIINVTPDSFYEGSRTFDRDTIARKVRQMISEGADMIDIGAYSSRPGAGDVSPQEETERLVRGLEVLRSIDRDIPVSIDTFRASVAETAVLSGADIVNDISGGDLDPDMFATVARLKVPYVLMHMRGTPATMQSMTGYDSLVADITRDIAVKLRRLRDEGVADVIVDPGFGFSKTTEQNYELLASLRDMGEALQCPVLAGVSRKSMISNILGISPDQTLNGTTVINTLALCQGVSFLRVHDVLEARQAVLLYSHFNKYSK